MMTGLAVLAPELRDEFGLSLTQVGVLIAAPWLGSIGTLFPWGLLADRVGERIVLVVGIGLCGALTGAVTRTSDFGLVVLLLALAGAAGASVNSASGRAVMSWFGPHERGLALGIRQTSTPVGAAIAALALPPIERAGGLDAAFTFLAVFLLVGATVGALIVRDIPGERSSEDSLPVVRSGRLWLLGASGALYLVAQVAVTGFLVLFLHEERGLSTGEAGAVLALVQILAIGIRIAVGHWSDVAETRLGPLRLLGLASFASLGLTAALLDSSTWVLVVSFVVAGAFSMSWNGLSFTAAAEFAGRARSGAAIGFQQTVLVASGATVPPSFAALVEATSWRAAFALAALAPLAGWALLAPLRER